MINRSLLIAESNEDYEEFVPCDHCGHRSYYEVTLESGRKLNYCSHFYNRSQDRIWEVAVRVVVRGNP